MAYKIPTDIGTNDLQNLTEISHCGHVHLHADGRFLRKSCWNHRYLILCIPNGKKAVWNLCCFNDPFSKKAEINYSLSDFESCKVYDDPKENVVGFVLRFEEPTEKPMTFRCDTEDSRREWVEKLQDAIKEAHKDSGYSSEADRQSKKYDTIDDDDEDDVTDTDVNITTNELKLRSTRKRTEAVSAANCLDVEISAPCESGGLQKHMYENWKTGASLSKSNKTNAEFQDTTIEYKRNTDETHVKEFASHPVQETIPDDKCNGGSEKSHDKRNTKKNNTTKQSTYDHATQLSKSDSQLDNNYENVNHDKKVGMGCIKYVAKTKQVFCELANVLDQRNKKGESKAGKESDFLPPSQTSAFTGQANNDDNTALKVLEDSPELVSATCESTLLSFLSVGGRSDSFVSVGKGSVVDSNSSLGEISFASKENEIAGCLVTRQKTLKSSEEGRSKSKIEHLGKYQALTKQQKYSRPSQSAFSWHNQKRFTDVSVELSNDGCESKEKKGSETSQSLIIKSCDVSSASNQQLTSNARTLGTESRQCILHESETDKDQSHDDECNIYENTEICFNKERHGQRPNENDNRRDSNNSNTSSLHSTQSSSSFSSRDSNTSTLSTMAYESPDESAHYENMNFFRQDEYNCKEKKEAKRVLQNRSIGTFVVCSANPISDLCVVTGNGIRSFRIHKQEEKLSLFENFSNPDYVFPTLDTLLYFYHINDLPSKNFKVKLERGYKCNESV